MDKEAKSEHEAPVEGVVLHSSAGKSHIEQNQDLQGDKTIEQSQQEQGDHAHEIPDVPSNKDKLLVNSEKEQQSCKAISNHNPQNRALENKVAENLPESSSERLEVSENSTALGKGRRILDNFSEDPSLVHETNFVEKPDKNEQQEVGALHKSQVLGEGRPEGNEPIETEAQAERDTSSEGQNINAQLDTRDPSGNELLTRRKSGRSARKRYHITSWEEDIPKPSKKAKLDSQINAETKFENPIEAEKQNNAFSSEKPENLTSADQNLTPEISSKAEEHKVVWAKIKGFPHWPAQIMSSQGVILKRLGAQTGKADIPVMFFMTLEVAWMTKQALVSWGEGVRLGFNLKKDKRMRAGFEQASTLLRDGSCPKGWWCKNLSAANSPIQTKRKPEQTDKKAKKDKELSLKSSARQDAINSRKRKQKSKPSPIIDAEQDVRRSGRKTIPTKVYAENSAQEVFDKDEVFTSSDESEMDFTFLKIKLETKEGSKNNGAMSEPIRGKRPYNRKIKLERNKKFAEKVLASGGVLKKRKRSPLQKKLRKSLPPIKLLENRKSGRKTSALPASTLQLLGDGDTLSGGFHDTLSDLEVTRADIQNRSGLGDFGKSWNGLIVELIPNEESQSVSLNLKRKKRKYRTKKQKLLQTQHEKPYTKVNVNLMINEDQSIKLKLLYEQAKPGVQINLGANPALHSNVESGYFQNRTSRQTQINGIQIRSQKGMLPGGQAPLEEAQNTKPPKYEYTNRNIWANYLSRPKRLARDTISTCDCHPVLPVEGGIPLSEENQASLNAFPERNMRARSKIVGEAGKQNCGPDCVNRQSFIHCDPKSCPCGTDCTNKPFHKLKLARLTAFHTGDRGWGVRSGEYLPANSFVVEYTGELLNKAEKQRRVEDQAKKQILDFYMMEHSPGVIIDARLKGNLARLINSSCDPNCETQKWRDAATDECRIGIFTKRDVFPGEELSYDYNFEHSGLAEAAGAYRCKCGAANCRGTMDTQPQRLKDAFRRIDVYWEADRMYYRGTVNSYNATSGTHIIYYDDGQKAKENLAEMSYRWLDESAECCIFGLPEDSLPEIPIIKPIQNPPANSPKMVRSRRGGRPRGKRKRETSMQIPESDSLHHLQEQLLYDSFDDAKEKPKLEQLEATEMHEDAENSKHAKVELSNGVSGLNHTSMISKPEDPAIAGGIPLQEYKQELSMNGVIPEKASEAIQVGAQTEGNLGVVQVSKGVDMINKGISLDAIDYCPEQNLPLNNDVFLTRTKASVSDCMN